MFRRFKSALVKSFVGAVGLGWIFAEGISRFASIFSAPISRWLARREYSELVNHGQAAFSPQDALPELTQAFVLLLIGYLLLRWLYYKPLENESANLKLEPIAAPEK
jgi:hypothetical protein